MFFNFQMVEISVIGFWFYFSKTVVCVWLKFFLDVFRFVLWLNIWLVLVHMHLRSVCVVLVLVRMFWRCLLGLLGLKWLYFVSLIIFFSSSVLYLKWELKYLIITKLSVTSILSVYISCINALLLCVLAYFLCIIWIGFYVCEECW